MREDPWRDLEEVAKQLGLSTRTVQRRLTALKEGKVIYLHRPPNADVVTGLMCNFQIFFSDPSKKRAADYDIHSTFRRIGASDTTHAQFSVFGMSCENFSEADKVTERLQVIRWSREREHANNKGNHPCPRLAQRSNSDANIIREFLRERHT